MRKRWLQVGIAWCIALSIHVSALGQCRVVQVAAGSAHSMALGQDGRLWGWGSNGFGQLGIGTFDDRDLPIEVAALSDVTSVGCGSAHVMALAANGDLWVWGGNGRGQLGNGGSAHVSLPFHLLTGAVVVGAGHWHSLAVLDDDRVLAWGENGAGALGDGSKDDSNTPVEVVGLTGVRLTQVVGGNGHSLGLASDGMVWAWGSNLNGQLGDGTTVDSLVPKQVPGLSDVVAIAAGSQTSHAVVSDGSVRGWGSGNLGNGTPDASSVPVRAATSNVVGIDGTKVYVLIVRGDGSVWGWGSNRLGGLGQDPDTVPWLGLPTRIDGPERVVSVAVGSWHSLAADEDGVVWAWGWNLYGQLGNGTTTDSTVPIPLNPDPIPPGQGNVLRAVRLGDDVELSFAAAPATSWRLYHDPDKLSLGTTPLVPDAVTPTYTDLGAIPRAGSEYYQLRGLSPCSSTPGP